MEEKNVQLSCYNVKVRAVSDLQDGLQLLKLLSTMDQTSSIENVEPGKAFPNIEKQLCEYHSCLPARFLSSGVHRRERYNDIQLATTSVLALSALALRVTSCSPTSEVAPLLKLDEATQCCIRDLIEIVRSGDDVLENLAAYLKASNVEEESFLCVATLKRRKSESFTASPAGAQTPAKRSSMSPQQRGAFLKNEVDSVSTLRTMRGGDGLASLHEKHWQGTRQWHQPETDSPHRGETGSVDGSTGTGEVQVEDVGTVERCAHAEGPAGAYTGGGTAGEVATGLEEEQRVTAVVAGKVAPVPEGKQDIVAPQMLMPKARIASWPRSDGPRGVTWNKTGALVSP
ncbi:hypothetical protein HPB52_007997 [Rhipicephalus sanguineus]|uniref:Uncharacterized protein n=1 Tax=Rhipicephalus sanguineus TaxID=34632 RepID=A0A9D4SU62_RHISA|nr:hypothetical protein HPB52_007997 [Rhipicephalus sanguineus]